MSSTYLKGIIYKYLNILIELIYIGLSDKEDFISVSTIFNNEAHRSKAMTEQPDAVSKNSARMIRLC